MSTTVNRLWVHGCYGRTGGLIFTRFMDHPLKATQLVGGSGSAKISDAKGHVSSYTDAKELTKKLDDERVSCVIDFSSVAGNRWLADYVLQNSTTNAVLIGTTGLDAGALARWCDLATAKKLRVLIAPNTSLGVLAMAQAARVMRRVLAASDFDVELVEAHHRQKVDAPSGTALYLAHTVAHAAPDLPLTINSSRSGKRVPAELGVHAVRGGYVAGKHELQFLGEYEELTLSHTAYDRKLFALGAQRLMQWLLEQSAGYYTLDEVIL